MARRILQPLLLGVAITCVVSAMVLDDWNCGSLFKSCLDRNRNMTLSVIILFCVGLACLAVAFLMDMIHCCSTSVDLSPGFTTTRLLILFSGLTLLCVGIIVYTAEMGRQWSYLSGVSGTVFAVQGAIVALMTFQAITRCGTRTQVTRTVVQAS